ncbi:hypothetical protein E4T56_gene10328 [Termitomyces sp. T112]|nr:hypothetical protein E4T56_gene10328 [Termitomyces sp. T112]
MDDFNLRSNLEGEAPQLSSTSLDEIREHIEILRDQIMAGLPPNQLSHAQVQDLLNGLPRVTEQELSDLGHKDSSCPICITPYLAIIAEEEVALVMDSPAHPVEELGITRLSKPWQCGHIFCRRDISKWITEAHDSCPMCRQLLVQPTSTRGVESGPSEPIHDHDSLLSSLERQLEHHASLLRSLDILGSLPVLRARNLDSDRVNAEPGEDRTHFAGMYS